MDAMLLGEWLMMFWCNFRTHLPNHTVSHPRSLNPHHHCYKNVKSRAV